MVLERDFQARIIKQIQRKYPRAVIIKTDPAYLQGFPDWLILNYKHWAALEIKRHKNALHQPNQDFWVEILNGMSFARFLYPENAIEVLDGLQQTLRPTRSARFP